MADLPRDIEALLERARTMDEPGPGDRQRVHGTLMRSIAAGGAGAGPGDGGVGGDLPATRDPPAGEGGAAGTFGAGGSASGAALGGGAALKWGAGIMIAAVGTTLALATLPSLAPSASSPDRQQSVEPKATPDTALVDAMGANVPPPKSLPARGSSRARGAAPVSAAPESDGGRAHEVAGTAPHGVIHAKRAARAPVAAPHPKRTKASGRSPGRTPRPAVSTRVAQPPVLERPVSNTAPIAAPTPTPVADTAGDVDDAPPQVVDRASPAATRPLPTMPSNRGELSLLSDATRALGRGELQLTMARLTEHRRLFPRGVLSEERDALRAIALCKLGRMSEGRRARDRFLDQRPGSPLAERVRTACVEPD